MLPTEMDLAAVRHVLGSQGVWPADAVVLELARLVADARADTATGLERAKVALALGLAKTR